MNFKPQSFRALPQGQEFGFREGAHDIFFVVLTNLCAKGLCDQNPLACKALSRHEENYQSLGVILCRRDPLSGFLIISLGAHPSATPNVGVPGHENRSSRVSDGFHHASFESGFGYCTFNGLLVAALALKAEGQVKRVGILDGDQHYGDGSAEIIAKLGIDWIRHVSEEYAFASDAPQFFRQLPSVMRDFADCDLLIYQAGADQHVDDPLGGFLTTAELAERDRLAFSMAKKIGIPAVWNLAGGYQQPLPRELEIHRNTIAACVAEYVISEQ